MKRLVKTGLKALWRGTLPIRRPLMAKFEAYLARCLRPTERFLTEETNVLMDHVVRELVRLQRQVESLQQAIEELSPAQGSVAIAGEIDPESRPAAEHLKAG